jgi:hypothetical protein
MISRVDRADDEKELEALRRRARRGPPYGEHLPHGPAVGTRGMSATTCRWAYLLTCVAFCSGLRRSLNLARTLATFGSATALI